MYTRKKVQSIPGSGTKGRKKPSHPSDNSSQTPTPTPIRSEVSQTGRWVCKILKIFFKSRSTRLYLWLSDHLMLRMCFRCNMSTFWHSMMLLVVFMDSFFLLCILFYVSSILPRYFFFIFLGHSSLLWFLPCWSHL